MRHYIIASHKYLAEGFYSAVETIVGKVDNVHIMCAYINDEDLDTQIHNCLNVIPVDSEIVVFTDIYGGSVNTRYMNALKQRHFHLISGINLALIISIMVELQGAITKESIKEKIEECRNSMRYCNEDLEMIGNEEEDEEF